MSEFKIENNIPMPKARTAPNEYPFEVLKVGQSFFVREENHLTSQRVRSVASLQNVKLKPKHFAVRRVNEPKLGFRIWRTQ